MIRTAVFALVLAAAGLMHVVPGMLASMQADEAARSRHDAAFTAVYTACLNRASLSTLRSDVTDATGCDHRATVAANAAR